MLGGKKQASDLVFVGLSTQQGGCFEEWTRRVGFDAAHCFSVQWPTVLFAAFPRPRHALAAIK
jgi:hypothetical protein